MQINWAMKYLAPTACFAGDFTVENKSLRLRGAHTCLHTAKFIGNSRTHSIGCKLAQWPGLLAKKCKMRLL